MFLLCFFDAIGHFFPVRTIFVNLLHLMYVGGFVNWEEQESDPIPQWSNRLFFTGLLWHLVRYRNETRVEAGEWFALLVIGMMLGVCWWCQHSLQPFFTKRIQIMKDHQLIVNRGPYLWLIHPSHTSHMLGFLSMTWFLQPTTVAWIDFLLIPWSWFLVKHFHSEQTRIQREEKLLWQRFDRRWIEYRDQRGRYLPGRGMDLWFPLLPLFAFLGRCLWMVCAGESS